MKKRHTRFKSGAQLLPSGLVKLYMKLRTVLPITLLTLVVASSGVQADAFKPSKAEQVKLGKQASAEIRKKARVVSTYDERVRMLRKVGNRLVSEMNLKNEPWEFTFDMIEDKSINAFALPGGPVFFNTGLVDRLESEDELAGVLAHELTHVRKEHWAYAYAEQQKRQLGLTAIFLLLRPSRAVGDLLGLGSDLILSLPYSRKHETEADDLGVDLMANTGYNPNAMADVFTMMQKESKGGTAEFLSTHPNPANRVKHIMERAAQMNRTFPPEKPLPWIAD